MRVFGTLALTLFAGIVLWHQIAFTWREGIHTLPSAWRFWDDMTLGIARYVDATSPGEPLERDTGELAPLVSAFREPVEEKVRTFEVEPHQFWRTVNDRKFRVRLFPYAQPPFEDSGRSRLLALGFRVVGGVAPFLLLWLGALTFIPILGWMMHELVASGLSIAGLTLAALVAFSPFFVECLTLPHSAVAFYLGGVMGLGAFSVAVFLPPRGQKPSWRPLALKSVLLSALLIGAIWCRSGTIFLIPPAFLVAAYGFEARGLPRKRAVSLAVALIVMPALLLRPQQTHNVWVSVWEGLGDFGTDRGYSWYDVDANRFLARQGVPGFADPKEVTAAHEAAFRQAVVSDVVASPLWYGRVLARRVFATVALTKLAPWGPRDGESRSAPLFHYKYATPIDWFGWRGQHIEVPISMLFAPTLALFGWGAFDRGRLRGEASVLAALALACLLLPVVISTASGLETQAFGLVYFLGAAFLAQRVADYLAARFHRA